MKSFNVELKQEFRVVFTNPELAQEYFVGEDCKFAEFMYENDSLDDLAGSLSYGFAITHQCGDDKVDIEGFALFKSSKFDTYISSADEYGDIIVSRVTGLEVDWVVED
jgi:hypothetical protein